MKPSKMATDHQKKVRITLGKLTLMWKKSWFSQEVIFVKSWFFECSSAVAVSVNLLVPFQNL
jgi:hypothetical protein